MMTFTGTILVSALHGAGIPGTTLGVGIHGAVTGIHGALVGTHGIPGTIHGAGIPGTLLLYAFQALPLSFPDPERLKTVRVSATHLPFKTIPMQVHVISVEAKAVIT